MTTIFNNLYMLAQQESDTDTAHMLIEKQCQLADVLDMGEYEAVSPKLDLATSERDIDTTIDTMEKMLVNIDKLGNFTKPPLYQHLDFKEMDKKFIEQHRKNLKEIFSDEETFSYMKNNKR